MSFGFSLRRWVGLGMAALLLAGSVPQAHAANIKVEVLLVWGTDAEKSSDEKHKALDKDIADELKKVFKWKNYFVVNRTKEEIASRQTKTIKISEKCSMEIQELPGLQVEVTLVGQGIKVNRTTYPLSKDKLATIAGGDKNDCAWFVIIKQIE